MWLRGPLVPVIVTEYSPAVPLQDNDDVVAPPMLVGLRVHVRPRTEVGRLRLTMPDHPLSGTADIAEAPCAPAFTGTLDGFGDRAKSWTVTRRVAGCERDPLVPVTVTVYVLAVGELQDKVEVALAPAAGVTLAGLRLQLIPVLGTNDAVRLTTPLKRF